jgi:ferric-dicitrate binding protein FerR (iron transport regulator)
MTIEPDDWEAQEPPADFADRVMARIEGESLARPAPTLEGRRRPRALRAGIAGGLALAAAIALAVGWHGRGAVGGDFTSHGDAVAAEREEVHLGARGIAVLERGAHVAWSGDEVTQSGGDVFYRVERGGTFRVHTPSGDVQVLGTCFRVRVENEENGEEAVNLRDVKVGAIGAALGAAAFVSAYEGKVALSQPSHGASVTLTAGESARADARGVAKTSEGTAEAASARGAGGGDEPLLAANANLADSVREYKRRLETIEAQKTALDKQLADAQQKLGASQRDALSGPERSSYDLTPDDWKDLAAKGELRARFPCIRRGQKDDDFSNLQKLGLPPQDGPIVQKAIAASRARIWALVRPLCANALGGDFAAADKLGVATCEGLVREAAQNDGVDVSGEMRQVAEMRAGTRPIPSDGGDAVVKLLLGLTGESGAIERDLASQLGPADAKSLVYGDDSPACWSNSSWTSGPKAVLPPK